MTKEAIMEAISIINDFICSGGGFPSGTVDGGPNMPARVNTGGGGGAFDGRLPQNESF